jgi:hypothetical protein
VNEEKKVYNNEVLFLINLKMIVKNLEKNLTLLDLEVLKEKKKNFNDKLGYSI